MENNNKPKKSVPKGLAIPVIIGVFALSVYGNTSQNPKNTSKNYNNEINTVTNQVATISKEDNEIYTSFQNTFQNMISETNEVQEESFENTMLEFTESQSNHPESNTTKETVAEEQTTINTDNSSSNKQINTKDTSKNTQKETSTIVTNTNKTTSQNTKSQTQTNKSTSSSTSSNSSSNKSSTTKNKSNKSTSNSSIDQNSTVYITKSGSKYHRNGCSSLRKSKISITKKEAIARGYGACKRCNP